MLTHRVPGVHAAKPLLALWVLSNAPPGKVKTGFQGAPRLIMHHGMCFPTKTVLSQVYEQVW